jgi:hypothetical protein
MDRDRRMATTVVNVEMREVVRCDFCSLVQYRTNDSLCRKCRKPLDIEEPVSLTPQLDTLLPVATTSEAGSDVDPELDSNAPPPRAAKFLLLLLPPRNRDCIIGDLEEEYRTVLLREYGEQLARFYYWWHVILACVSSILGVIGDYFK